MKLTLSTTLLALLLPVLAVPNAVRHVIRRSPNAEGAVPDSYIVVLKSVEAKEAQLAALKESSSLDNTDSVVEITYDAEYSAVLPNAYAATLKGAALEQVLADPNVDYVEENGIFTIDTAVVEVDSSLEKRGPTAEEFEARRRELEKRHDHGIGVIVYSIDTGVWVDHTEFLPPGRAKWGATFGPYANADGNGHGTHTAGTAAGVWWGVAGQADVIGIKVLSDGGSGSWADVVAGVNFAAAHNAASGKPGIANLSLGGGATAVIDAAIAAAVAGGLHVTVSAGNSNFDAQFYSPARVAVANTVGAIDSADRKASFSNYGALVDVWAPGVNIKSAYITGPIATANLSGTSMSAPYVAGVLAKAISRYGNKSPADLSADLKSHAVASVLGAPAGTTTLKAQVW